MRKTSVCISLHWSCDIEWLRRLNGVEPCKSVSPTAPVLIRDLYVVEGVSTPGTGGVIASSAGDWWWIHEVLRNRSSLAKRKILGEVTTLDAMRKVISPHTGTTRKSWAEIRLHYGCR